METKKEAQQQALCSLRSALMSFSLPKTKNKEQRVCRATTRTRMDRRRSKDSDEAIFLKLVSTPHILSARDVGVKKFREIRQFLRLRSFARDRLPIMNKCVTPTVPVDADGDARWTSQHNRHLAETNEKEPDVVFIGDQIIQDLHERPIWNDLFEPLHSLNLGISHDCTENVLYRIQDGILDDIKPKVVVVHVGTCNINDAAEDVAEGIIKVVEEIQSRLPEAHIILLELLPRGQMPNPLREKNEKTNEYVRQKLSLKKGIEIIPASKTLIQTDGSISHHDMPDYLALTEAGYRKIFEPIYELILQLFGENDVEEALND